MEENNGRNEQTLDVDAIVNENNQLKEALNNLVNRVNELNNSWVITRANYLFEVIKNDAFPANFKEKAMNELCEFLYPTEKKEECETKYKAE